MVSDSTLISMPWKGWAASMNHCISLSWSSRDRVEGWNSLSTQRSAAAMSAQAAPGDSSASAATVPNIILFIGYSSLSPCAGRRPASSSNASHPPEHAGRVDEREAESPPQVRADEPEPCEMNEGGAEQRDEQAVATRRVEAEDAAARRAAGRGELPGGHARQQCRD